MCRSMYSLMSKRSRLMLKQSGASAFASSVQSTPWPQNRKAPGGLVGGVSAERVDESTTVDRLILPEHAQAQVVQVPMSSRSSPISRWDSSSPTAST